MNTIATVKNND